MVASYLQKKGYRATEAIFTRESKGETISLGKLLDDPTDEKGKKTEKTSNDNSVKSKNTHVVEQTKEEEKEDPDIYDVSYKSLRQWIENSLDWYKPELRSVLFPIFVHSYLDLVSKNIPEKAKYFMDTYRKDHVELHTLDLNTFETITEPQHVRENELARMYRSNKYNLRMSGVPFELFLNYLQDNKFMILLRIVNQYLNIQVVHGKLLKSAGGLEMDDVIGIIGHQAQQIEEFNKQKVQLGLPQLDQSFKEEVEQAIKEQEDESQQDDNISLLETFKRVTQENTADGPAFGDIPLPPYRGTDITTQIESLKNLTHTIPLNESSLPSICCYTFHNTHDSLNCVTITKDATLIAGGFSESYIKIWSLKGEKLRSLRNTINPALVNDYNDLNRQKERYGHEYKKLIGHSGPVFGLSFSPDNKYLVSCSEDKTARLWSTQTFTNLVIYKGHNSPVWDVDFGPFGFYFATGSHDRTARLWSCDHINPLRIFAGHLSDVDTVKFHPNSKYLVTGSSDRTSRLWDIQKGTCVRVFTGHTGAIKTVAVSPNGRLMASAGEDKSIMLWDIGSGKCIKKLTGHTGFIYSLKFSADNGVLVSGGADNTVCVWDVNTDLTSATVTYMDTDHDMNGTKRLKIDNDKKRKAVVHESRERLAVFPTKQTPIYDIQFTDRNLCLVAGAFTQQKTT
ncbi:WD40-repeat-containing domain protein [Cokeromyces recurvatus]|uniref:WD40-repeat-containing domain protein n=1 Tax=Cokeromyces recurvatus TaxID=90255 RepID=UPI00221F889C|nr:WD40-repeat-containing domain protein [Cokeromyces recurvatus]KAI7900010.1 WD40-repeat-containing domain protein [Cokeromyces recurvatus]